MRGILKRRESKNNCVVGDIVEISDDNYIIGIDERKNLLERPIVVNIDYFVIQFAAKDPDIDLDRLDVMLLRSFFYKIKPVIVINKIDLLNESEFEELKIKLDFLTRLDIPCFFISKKENIDIEELKAYLKDHISAFGGPSGVGKSSIINMLQSEKVLEVGETSKRLRKGKHTTKDTNLLPLNGGGYIIDTPGFSSVELPDIKTPFELMDLFPEFAGRERCKFNDCHHLNEPGCKIKEAVEKNTLEKSRYEFYKKVYEKLKDERWNKYE